MYAESLTYRERKRFMNYAIISSCFGVVIQISLKESTLFIVYAASIGAGKFLSLATTSVIPLMTLLFLIPFAYIMERTGLKRFMIPAYFFGMTGMLVAALAGFFPQSAIFLFTAGIMVYAVSIGAHSAGWFPLQRFIIPEGERGAYFGRLRYTWQIAVSVFLLITALIVQEDAETGKLQLIIIFGSLLIVGRILFLYKIPEKPPKRRVAPLKVMLAAAFANRPLFRFSWYLFFTSFFIASALPLGFAFLTYELKVADNILVLFSMVANLATITGFIIASRISDRYNNARIFAVVMGTFSLVYLLYLAIGRNSPVGKYSVMILALVAAAAFSLFSVLTTKKMMFLVKDNNVNISSALCFGLYNGGIGISRLVSSLCIDYLPDPLRIGALHLTPYQVLFVFFGAGIAVMAALSRRLQPLTSV